jgi:hypothetical protein
MSSIPPVPILSAVQAGVAQSEQTRPADAARNADTDRARLSSAGPDAILEIEEADGADTQVHTDSGGLGSQGRYDAPPEGASPDDQLPSESGEADAPPKLDLLA